jgi:hypothetical protein
MRNFARCLLPAVAALAVLFSAVPARSQCREGTTQERQAAENAARIVQQSVEKPIASLGWTPQSEKSALTTFSVATNPNPPRPLMSCSPIFDARLEINSANSHYAMIHAETELLMSGKIKPGSPDMAEASRATAASQIEIRATENVPYMRGVHSAPLHKIDLPGAAVAFQETSASDQLLQEATICFGAWKPDVVYAAGGSVPFPFAHPKGTPFIENLCVRITAAPNMLQELLSKVDWQQLNAALSAH